MPRQLPKQSSKNMYPLKKCKSKLKRKETKEKPDKLSSSPRILREKAKKPKYGNNKSRSRNVEPNEINK